MSKEYYKEYYKKNKEEILKKQNEKSKEYYKKNREEILKKQNEKSKEYYKKNREEILKKKIEYIIKDYKKNKEEILKKKKEYYKYYMINNPLFRAKTLLETYIKSDNKYKRGKCDITAEWIVDNIFTKSCVYCGEDDWHKLGCDRKDNSLPHTTDNIVPCCCKCNRKKGRYNYDEYMEKIKNI